MNRNQEVERDLAMIAGCRAVKAEKYDQLVADLQNTGADIFVEQLREVLRGMETKECAALYHAWITNNYGLVDSILRTEHIRYIHAIAGRELDD